ncbi:MaoC family dehydratase [Mycobacterium kyorinense]|uniref:Dehydratase n=1 Tax=Mycobacterium kyorinense TaxID=487514 RepID=A0A1X1XR13_9MYCO|nr:MaoC family dehydratase [Mycobacterium kyorinense]ORW01221.1 dehydratase [Mycobacterium kyorinense]
MTETRSAPVTYDGVAGFEAHVGEHLGFSDWRRVTQKEIDLFADATGDYQWIHVDPVRAANGPYGTTIAHGYLTLSLVPVLVQQIYKVTGLSMQVNYGVDKLRFPSPVPVDSRIRAGAELLKVERSSSGARATVRVTVEIEGASRPACVVDTIALMVD